MPITSVMLRDLARPALQAVGLDDQVDGRGDLLPHRLDRQLEAGHHDHRFEPGQGVARRVGVQRGHRAVVAGVHGLEHVERLGAAALADDDPFGPHTQGVRDQVAACDRALAFDVRRPRFQADDVVLLQLQFGRVLDRDDALVVRDEARQRVEQRRLTGAGAAAR